MSLIELTEMHTKEKDEVKTMRDVNRIKPFCDEFAELWTNYPDLRFGQIMSNIARYVQMEHKKDMFFMEEDELMEIIRHQLRSV